MAILSPEMYKNVPSDNCRIGLFDYNDAATSITPISVTGGSTSVLTNDGAGAFTNKTYAPVGVTDVWDATTDSFDFSQLKLGDILDIRLDITVTTVHPNTDVGVYISLGTGVGEYNVVLKTTAYKNSGLQSPFNSYSSIYMGNTNTLNNGGQLVIEADKDCTVVVTGWYCKVLIRG